MADITQIRQDFQGVTLINVFTPKPAKQQEFCEVQTREYQRLAGQLKGSLTVNLHRSLDGERVVNYAQFSSLEDFEAWRSSDLFREHFERIRHLVEHAEPRLYEVVYVRNLT
jgi:heme-degrading monooxygenase HmoA